MQIGSSETVRDDESTGVASRKFREDEAASEPVSNDREDERDGDLPPKAARRTKFKKRLTDGQAQSLKDAYFASGRRVTRCPPGKPPERRTT